MVVGKKSAYEESRQKRLDENKKRMAELNLIKLSQTLHTPKPSPMKKVKPKLPKQPLDPSSFRRSSRVAVMPTKSYKEIPVEAMGKPRSYTSKRRDLLNRVYATVEEREYATQRAEDLQSSLDQDIPSFVKSMLQSHISGGFWLGLPNYFCKERLPNHDERINLVDEKDEVFETKYIALKHGLSAGWRGFATKHNLVDGDCLVFQLTEPTKFKVYIIRVKK